MSSRGTSEALLESTRNVSVAGAVEVTEPRACATQDPEDGKTGLLAGSPDLRDVMHPSEGAWITYRAKLEPKFGIARRDLAICMLMVFGGFAGHILVVSKFGNTFGIEIGIFFAVWIGFWLNAVLSFGHEAAHYNMARSRKTNDRLADWTVWLFFPETTKTYRRSHWLHHLHLGDAEDTEISYRNCLSPWFIAKTLTGIYLVNLISRYVFHTGSNATTGKKETSGSSVARTKGADLPRTISLLRTAAVHFAFLGFAYEARSYSTMAVWIMASALLFPAFASIRQILEHRSAHAACEADPLSGEIAVNRMFGRDFFSRYFGAAGFNRHLLHHWDPTVSYTRFDDMESFFSVTEYRGRIERAGSSYFSSFRMLLRSTQDGK